MKLERLLRTIIIKIDYYKASEDLKIIGQIYRKDMSEFLDFLSDENGMSFEKLYIHNFDEVIAWLK